METVKYDLKLFLQDAGQVDLADFIPVFHDWIQDQSLDELLIDVVDYRHVHDGPGVMLIAHDAHYAIDYGGRTNGAPLQPAAREPSNPERHPERDRASALRAAVRPPGGSGSGSRTIAGGPREIPRR